MPSTRSSARQTENTAGSSPPSAKSSAGTKRKADEATNPSAGKSKRGRPSKDQKTLEETITTDAHPDEVNGNEKTGPEVSDEETKTALDSNDKLEETSQPSKEPVADSESKEEIVRDESEPNAFDKVRSDEHDATKDSKNNEEKDANDNGDAKQQQNEASEEQNDSKTNGSATGKAIENDKEREEKMPSNILEKGIIYFFSRGRVGVDDPDSVQDLARSYFVMRPLPAGAKLTDGAIQDLENNRLIALPKKVWPKSGKDRFMAFVEKGKTSIKTLKEEFFAGSEYSTKTAGTRQTPEVTPLGEGVYAITSTGSGRPTTHLAYMLTVPEKIGEVQTDVGLAEKGSFVLSLKNPESSGPAYAQLPEKPDFPKEFIEEFSGRGWLPAHPKHLEYPNAQMLLIGEDFDSSSNMDPAPKDERDEKKETPQEELEKLEDEDEHRVENLRGDDSIFDDLGISKKDYPKVLTTW